MSSVRDVVIIGSGPAGYTAGLYTARAMLNPLMFAGYMSGGQLMLTSDIENFPGYPQGIGGPEMMMQLREQAERFGLEVQDRNVESVDLSQRPYKVVVEGEEFLTNAIIISTGAESIWLNAPGEAEQKGRGISTCATCDGAFFRDEEVLVIGGGDSACEEATFLTRFASKVTLVHRRDVFRASTIMYERAANNDKIEIKTFRQVKEWLSDENGLTGAVLEDPRDGSIEEIAASGAFIAIGHKPITGFLGGQVETDDNGYIIHKQHTMTSVEGVFAAGDVVDTRYKQAITAAGMGCQAAMDAEKWLEENLH
ncbi:MAG: thioredoxin-disulfide reductase [Candidatus Thermoplasmatota archaeon]|nr:thioredoxin-disulfide reductase [Candidatus Thermoplasmatota archaeon]DAC51272.1 MAG TPA: thioredoxin-disulfide reductase [Candidatus Poseidoniales archaeon]DAC59874.1 MAG TPA: thioredoxin-disulfide reductase [Candidatus Poseidoniales archaeon]HII24037.1 thioredoxin-disulfide reductase [Candidatus Poseidoniaceae archaeon]HII50337.1 thioredoxin-disulfide reductase [Candidatus Poseidoniaceae archaeon]|tara:strand:+ start:9310 stop:10239 length:930 start_codon:yes stop_codon:yes gene_type:complete